MVDAALPGGVQVWIGPGDTLCFKQRQTGVEFTLTAEAVPALQQFLDRYYPEPK